MNYLITIGAGAIIAIVAMMLYKLKRDRKVKDHLLKNAYSVTIRMDNPDGK
ncbi:MAG: hypothetical protein ACOYXC_21810 [Candidatus Rifleibacteriota bacterium]